MLLTFEQAKDRPGKQRSRQRENGRSTGRKSIKGSRKREAKTTREALKSPTATNLAL